ncbi:MAG: hypothetical protein MHPSP_002256, partial [Paramarteilia canceri]
MSDIYRFKIAANSAYAPGSLLLKFEASSPCTLIYTKVSKALSSYSLILYLDKEKTKQIPNKEVPLQSFLSTASDIDLQ